MKETKVIVNNPERDKSMRLQKIERNQHNYKTSQSEDNSKVSPSGQMPVKRQMVAINKAESG